MARPNSSPAMVMTATLSAMRIMLLLRPDGVLAQRRVGVLDERRVDELARVHRLIQEAALHEEHGAPEVGRNLASHECLPRRDFVRPAGPARARCDVLGRSQHVALAPWRANGPASCEPSAAPP